MSSNPDPDASELGYVFHPRLRPHAPGHPQLDVVLRAVPTGQHFDPHTVRLTVTSPQGKTEILTVRHPEQQATRLHACAGPVSLHDRKGKTVEAFTFGGDLQITPTEEHTTCVLTSPAPIIEIIPDPLTGGPTVTTLLVKEVEGLIARRRAAWDRDHPPARFGVRLAAADPLTLYLACLQALQDQFARFPRDAEDELTLQLVHFLNVEIKALHDDGTWPLGVPALDKLL